MRRYSITLTVPVEDDELPPAMWDWQDLIGTADVVSIIESHVVTDVPGSDDCPRHGGKWGDDDTCITCTFIDGQPQPRPRWR